MQVAVAGVEHVGAAQPVIRSDSASIRSSTLRRAPCAESCRPCSSSRARCGRPRETPPCAPTRRAGARLVLRHADLGGAGLAQHARDLRHVGGDFLRRAVGLDQQHGRRVERIAACTNSSTARVAGRSIISSPAGTMPAAITAATAAPACADVVERRERDLRDLRLRRQLHGDLGDDREQALGAVDEREQVVAGAVQRVAAELDDLAGDQHAAHAPHVVHGEPVLEAVHAAGVLGDVAADRARDLRRRIRRVVEAVRRRRFGDREVAHAGLHDGGARERVDRRGCA